MSRRETFEREVSDFDERQLPKVLDFKSHRFVSIERDSVTGATYVRGHKSLRGACNYLADCIAGAERFVPERILDLDTGELHELDVFAFVAPKSVDATAVMMSRDLMHEIAQSLERVDPHANALKIKLLNQALQGRRA